MILARLVAHPGAFVHAVTEDGRQVFIHKSECDFRLNEAKQGDFVTIESLDECEPNPYARGVRWKERPVAFHPTQGDVVNRRGTIVELRPGKYGFIQPHGIRSSFFFHATGLDRCAFEDLKVGDEVEFTLKLKTERGKPMAVDVYRIGAHA